MITLGRDSENTIVINEENISRQHARLIRSGTQWEVEDNHSKNGTFLNGKRLQSGRRYPIQITDELKLASHIVSIASCLNEVQQVVTIGRHPDNTICVNFPSLSAHHAKVEVFSNGQMQIIDLNSTNGVFLNHRRIQAQFFSVTDTLHLGSFPFPMSRIQAVLENLVVPDAEIQYEALPDSFQTDSETFSPFSISHKDAPDNIVSQAQETDDISQNRLTKTVFKFSDLFPFWQRKEIIFSPKYLIPGFVGVSLLGTLFYYLTQFVGPFNIQNNIYILRFVTLLGSSITLGSLILIYRICGQRKSLWMFPVIICSVGFCIFPDWLYRYYLIFTETCIFPGDCPGSDEYFSSKLTTGEFSYIFQSFAFIFRGWVDSQWINGDFWQRFLFHFLEAGMMEEAFKITPVAILAVSTLFLSPVWKKRVGVNEPLDGILWASTAAVGFILVETFLLYVLRPIFEMHHQDANLGWLVAMQLGIIRSIDSITGHIGFSGYFGYFVGKAMLQRRYWWVFILCGFFSASLIHALHNAVVNHWVRLLVSFLTYFLLFGAIVNARRLSPRRSENFATRVYFKSSK